MSTVPAPIVFSSISEVERDVGIAKETLRVWERRYDFPRPQRDGHGERVYPPDQVHKLILVKRLLDQGYRPGKIMALDSSALAELGGKPTAGTSAYALDAPEITLCLALLREHKTAELRQRLSQSMLTMGLQRCVMDLIAPLTTAVGVAWVQGQLAVFEEHLYADMLQTVLRNAIVAATGQRNNGEHQPRVILTTVPQERHGLGLLMVEALLALEGAHCISLGVQTPLSDIVAAVKAHRADIVALSFSGVTSPRAAVDNINELRARLGDGVELWAGGAGVAMARRHLQPGTVLDLHSLAPSLERWRGRKDNAAVVESGGKLVI
ncbi:MAG: cobalamin-binding protein [Massilia sp.]|nr:cobalamin-binding protein [Massilia sp.]